MRQISSFSEHRRGFLKDSANLGIVALGVSVLGAGNLFAAERKSAANDGFINKNGEQMVTLHNGVKMPIFGLGTYKLTGATCQNIVEKALTMGYRLIDTAQMYNNEREVGAGLKNALKSGIKREEVFIETKISPTDYRGAKAAIDERLKLLGVDFVDLLLIHWRGSDDNAMWQAFEEAYAAGKLRAIGVSNFIDNFENFTKSAKIAPMVNQLETHIFQQRKAFQSQMAKHGTILQSWSPFTAGRRDIFSDKTLLEIAQNHGKSVAQIVLRYLIERGICVIPKTSSEKRLAENFAIFDFSLSDDERATIAKMDEGKGVFGWY